MHPPKRFTMRRSLMPTLGGPKVVEPNTSEIHQLATYAINEYNKKENKSLKFQKAKKATEQVVSGVMYRITFEATDGDQNAEYEAKVWVKPWMNWKQLEDFNCIGNARVPVCN